jgi:hypothetical protein
MVDVLKEWLAKVDQDLREDEEDVGRGSGNGNPSGMERKLSTVRVLGA